MVRHGYIVVGAEQENPSQINCMDWHNEDIAQIPWHQRQVKAAPRANGYWMIEAERPGRYEFTPRQQPAVAAFPIQAARACVRVGEQEAEAAIPDGATRVSLTVTLKAGPARLQTWLQDDDSGRSRGAYFVEVRCLDQDDGAGVSARLQSPMCRVRGERTCRDWSETRLRRIRLEPAPASARKSTSSLFTGGAKKPRGIRGAGRGSGS
ncbi:MAG: hypothetical protein ACREIA_12570 [Opitutaceae bacterium]